MEINHFSHEHPLILSEEIDNEIVCKGCQKGFPESAYGCSQCKFYLHKSCSELPLEIRCFFHPCPLVIKITQYFESGFVFCNACHRSHWGFYYYCDRCQFVVGVECVTLRHEEGNTDNQIWHLSHAHPLTIADKKEDDGICCQVCRKLCTSQTYGCNCCNFFLHNYCMEKLPPAIQHFSHLCPLILLSTCNYLCNACHEEHAGLAFCCAPCNFLLDVQCALLPTMISKGFDKMIIHSFHFHPLTLYDYKDINDKICCKACNQDCSGPVYGCNRCKYYLHESCSKLPQRITHPSHPQHPLSLLPFMLEESLSPPCHSCDKKLGLFAYCCFTCSFALDVNCSLITPNIKYENHEHLLTVIEGGCSEDLCEACNKSCKGLYLRCVECSFNLHIQCHPLVPRTINHHCHIDPLSLTNLHDPDQLDPDEEFYCDACETLRNPEDPVYYCSSCDFTVHIQCVLSEVLAQITEDDSGRRENGLSPADHILAELDQDIADIASVLEELRDFAEDNQKEIEKKNKEKEDFEAKLQVIVNETEKLRTTLGGVEKKLEAFEAERIRNIDLRNQTQRTKMQESRKNAYRRKYY